MKIKDIVNRDLVNLENCESEPIHIPGSIQPHGFLLAVKQDNFIVDFCTSNVADFIGADHTSLLGKTFGSFFGEDESEKLQQYISASMLDASKPHNITYNNIRYNTTIHQSGNCYVLDMEPFPDGSLTLPDLYSQTKRFVSHLEDSVSLQELCQIIAKETRNIIGYDRVMIYRFDKEYNGEVFAESKRDDLESFFGLHYPHTDIPVQARELYMRNLMRIIVDVDYKPVPIYTIDDKPNKNLDLSNSVLRSVSPIHVEYLQNIGVGATLTISLIHNKKLWGLIACHHYSEKNLPHYTRLAAQLQGHFLTSQINVRQVAEEFDASQFISRSLESLLSHTFQFSSGHFDQIFTPDLLNITNASGVAILVEKKLYTYGLSPSQDKIQALIDWLFLHKAKGVYISSKLINDYAEAEEISDTASGILFHSFGTNENDCIIWFKPEVKKTVNWAGDPNKAIIKNEKGLSPRKSFELWKEVTKNQSEDWKEIELVAAQKFTNELQKQIHLHYITKEETKYRHLSEKLQKANSELENINWISTHDLKEPLRKIQVFASKILEEEKNDLSGNASDAIKRMSSSALRMQNLINDLMSYSHMRNSKEAFTNVDLNDLLEKIKSDLNEDIAEKNAIIEITDLPVIHGISFQLKQLFINLIQNSLKFSREDVPCRISVFCLLEQVPEQVPGLLPQQRYYKISVQDNGIGFKSDFSSSIFDVFKRLNSAKKYNGTGIGLAICKKIMENHEGAILATGEVNNGARFDLFFPA